MYKGNPVDQLMLSLALNEREAALCEAADREGQVCHSHTQTTLELSAAGMITCPMCDLDYSLAQERTLDDRYAAKAPAKRWWEQPVSDSPRPLPESAAFRSEWD